MASRITREGERNIRSKDFLQDNKADFTGNVYAVAQTEALNAEVAKTGDFYMAQISNDGDIRQHYEIAEEANDKLCRAMRDIADYAATIGEEIAGVEEKFRVTRSGGKRGRIARARVFAADAEEYRLIFSGRGLEPDFIEDLNDKADALEQALAAAASKTADRVGATEAKLLSHKKSNKIIASLDPIIRRLYRDNPQKLAAWDFASHIQRESKPAIPKPTS